MLETQPSKIYFFVWTDPETGIRHTSTRAPGAGVSSLEELAKLRPDYQGPFDYACYQLVETGTVQKVVLLKVDPT